MNNRGKKWIRNKSDKKKNVNLGKKVIQKNKSVNGNENICEEYNEGKEEHRAEGKGNERPTKRRKEDV